MPGFVRGPYGPTRTQCALWMTSNPSSIGSCVHAGVIPRLADYSGYGDLHDVTAPVVSKARKVGAAKYFFVTVRLDYSRCFARSSCQASATTMMKTARDASMGRIIYEPEEEHLA
ncbi:hypothetical protein CC86DRAFT_106788 [Ophiobolus disseminans]|uniref:Uncharacterized protein n=1 Tax=Ophiobolus disseminans TaxID=1469910 RepID=A0A6A6ZIP1_9PLEO|nr:hypothetical protein CC86DRAFT_106788 [Ophiobolus disseminans]